MANLTTLPIIDNFKTTLAQSWGGDIGTIYVNNVPSVTLQPGIKTYVVVNPGKPNQQVARISAWTTGELTCDSILVKKGAGTNYSQTTHSVQSEVIVSDNYQFWEDIMTAVNSKVGTDSVNTFTVEQIFDDLKANKYRGPVVADTTARDVLYPSPVTGDEVYVESLNAKQVYNEATAQRESLDVGTPPVQATESTLGIARIATQIQVDAGTDDETIVTPLKANGLKTPSALYEKGLIAGEDIDTNESVFVEEGPTFGDISSSLTTDTATYSFTNTLSTTSQLGIRFQSKKHTMIYSVTKDGSSNATRAILKTDVGNTTIATATFSGNIATFSSPQKIQENDFFRIELDNSGGNYNSRWVSTGLFPISLTNVIFVTGSGGGSNDATARNITAIDTGEDSARIGNITVNTRRIRTVFGSGVEGNTFKLSLKKFSSPSVDLGVRIEADNAGEPSGTLFHANATATVTSASLTTSLVDTTVTLAGNITIPKGQKVHVVLFAGTYGSETINVSNYFGLGYDANKNTTTRGLITYNGTTYSTDNNKFIYTESTLFQEEVLSLTDADYTYKLPTDYPRLVNQDYTSGEETTSTYFGLVDYPGLVDDTVYYIANTPGAISAVAGTNSHKVGKTVGNDKLLLPVLPTL